MTDIETGTPDNKATPEKAIPDKATPNKVMPNRAVPSKTIPSNAPPSNTVPTAKPRLSWLARLMMVCLLLGNLATVGGGIWLWRQLDLAEREQSTLQQNLKQQLDKSVELKKQLDEQVASEKRFRQQTTDVLKDNSEKLRGLDRIDTSYWRLAEAEFLLKQAHQRLFITHDAATADLLLASADSAIMQQKDPGLLSVRSAIASDRAELRKVPRIDRDGIYLRLQALSSQVGVLTSDNRFLQASEDTQADGESAGNYADMLWTRLLSIVRIRHHDQPVAPLLPPEQELYFHQNLQLALLQAQLGLLQSQQQAYAGNLERVFAWVGQYCQTSDPVVAAWLEEARSLMRINIAPEMPDISDSLRTVEKLNEQRAEEIRRALMLGDGEYSDTEADLKTEPEAVTPTTSEVTP
jgi:uroporphyrin-3 C-methyltransferase